MPNIIPKILKTKIMEPITTSNAHTQAEKERGIRQLGRLTRILDILYALMIFRVFLLLPRPEIDNFGHEELFEVLTTSYINYLVMFVGIVLILIYWGQSNLQSGNLVRTDGKHAVLSILQAISLMIYLYFVRLDVEFEGDVLILQIESISLALAGAFSILSWAYAIKNKLVSDVVTVKEKQSIYLKLLPEPIVSVLSFPFAFFGSNVWTLSWLMLIPVTMIIKRYTHKLVNEPVEDSTLQS